MNKRVFFLIAALILAGSFLWAGDTAVFVDLGFSPDGRIYMFGQYGVQSGTLRPWADLYIVDVPANNFVPGGRISYIHDTPVIAGQDGAGALYKVIARNAALAERYNINFLHQGQPLYVPIENGIAPPGGETIEFRDFEKAASFRATLTAATEGYGANVKSSFYIALERSDRNGVVKSFVVGNPQIKRPSIVSYRIRKVMVAPRDGSIVFVIEMKKLNPDGNTDIRYMVETLRIH
jgi:predicted secreted protein